MCWAFHAAASHGAQHSCTPFGGAVVLWGCFPGVTLADSLTPGYFLPALRAEKRYPQARRSKRGFP